MGFLRQASGFLIKNIMAQDLCRLWNDGVRRGPRPGLVFVKQNACHLKKINKSNNLDLFRSKFDTRGVAMA